MKKLVVALLLLCTLTVWSDPPKAFRVVVLGPEGGLAEGHLSSYLVAPAGTFEYLALDAGTLLSGLRVAAARGSLPPPAEGMTTEGSALRGIRGYLISHPHLDHMAGLILDSPEDTAKPIVGLDTTLDALRDHIFNGKLWANFGDEGPGATGRYHLQRVKPGTPFRVGNVALDIEAMPLSHSDCISTAYILHYGEAAMVYCGDTGPDQVEGGDRMHSLWRALAPLIRRRQLKALFLEVSFPDGRRDDLLFGHLTPTWMTRELHRLAAEVGPGERPLAGLTVVVTHIKPSLQAGSKPRELIRSQLEKLNDLGVRYLIPEQGQVLEF